MEDLKLMQHDWQRSAVINNHVFAKAFNTALSWWYLFIPIVITGIDIAITLFDIWRHEFRDRLPSDPALYDIWQQVLATDPAVARLLIGQAICWLGLLRKS